MVQREVVAGAWQVRLPIRGTGRWVAAAFLSAWLCAWAVGEVFIGGTLIAGFRDLVAPGFMSSWLPAMRQVDNVAPRFALLFMGMWLSFWTVGGALAMRELARMLFGEDIVRWDADGFESVQRGGPFVRVRRIAFDALRDLSIGQRGTLVADTTTGRVPVLVAGSTEERRELQQILVEAWNLSGGMTRQREREAEDAPMGWQVAMDENGSAMLVSDVRQRRTIAGVLVAISSMPAIAVATLMGDASGIAWLAVAGFSVLTLAGLGAAAWVATSRVELRPRQNGLTWRSSGFGRQWMVDYHPASLEVERSVDADGDERYRLVVRSGALSRELGAALQSPSSALHLGRWLARHMSAPIQGLEVESQTQRQAS